MGKREKICLKILILAVCLVLGVSSAIVVDASVYGYLTKETVEKSGTATVHSNSTGTNSFGFDYGAERTAGTLYVEVQYYDDQGNYSTIIPIRKTLNASNPKFSDIGYYPPCKMFRIQLSGSTGRGTGWIQGRA